jgi:nucleotide-binding universal stress UspA family protein
MIQKTELFSKPIVVGIDESQTAQHALRAALDLARSLGSELIVVSAYAPLREGELRASRREAPRDVAWSIGPDSAVRALLEDAREQAEAAGLTVECIARPGAAVPAILSVASDRGAGLVIVGNRGMRARRRLRGCVPDDVSHQAPCSVLIVDTEGAVAA